MVSCALDTTDERHRCCNARAAMVTPLGDPRSLPHLSWTACAISDRSWTSSKFQTGAEQQSSCGSCSGFGGRAEPALAWYPGMPVSRRSVQWTPLWPGPPNTMEKGNKTRQITALKKKVYCWLVPSAFLSLRVLGGGS